MPWLSDSGKGAAAAVAVAANQVPAEQRAKELGVPGYLIRRLVREGKISGTKIGGRVYVAADVEIPTKKRKKKRKSR